MVHNNDVAVEQDLKKQLKLALDSVMQRMDGNVICCSDRQGLNLENIVLKAACGTGNDHISFFYHY